jgi:hypothetical protein
VLSSAAENDGWLGWCGGVGGERRGRRAERAPLYGLRKQLLMIGIRHDFLSKNEKIYLL